MNSSASNTQALNKGFLNFVQSTLFVKDSQLSLLFLAMTKKEWFIAFATSPLALIVRPLLALSLLVLGVLQLFRMATTQEKTFELWVMTILGMSSVLLSNISVWGGIISYAAGLVFVAGPILFLTSLAVGLLMQLILSGEQAYRAFMAEHHSAEQMHHLQALVQNIIAGVQFAACIAALVFTVFAPLTPIVSGACAVLAVSLIVSVMAWRLIPHENKLAIKSFFGFAKPVVEKTDNSDIGKIVPAVTLHSRSEPVKNQEIVAPSAINGIRFFKSELVSCKCSGPIQEEPVLSAP